MDLGEYERIEKKVPTMKSQGAAKNEANNAAQTTVRAAEAPAVKIDLSKVKVEPLFEEFVDFVPSVSRTSGL